MNTAWQAVAQQLDTECERVCGWPGWGTVFVPHSQADYLQPGEVKRRRTRRR